VAWTERENILRNASYQGHQWIPQYVYVSPAYWQVAREGMERICLRHPALFPGAREGEVDYDAGVRPAEDRRVTDAWGCGWIYDIDGLDGLVIEHPLADWSALDTWRPPPVPEFTEDDARALRQARAEGRMAVCGSEHGYLFMRLFYLRGFDAFMEDVAHVDPRLERLADVVTDYWAARFRPYVEAGIDRLSVADDLGTQTASLLGPKHFRRLLLPRYKRLLAPARRSGAHVAMHHDGYVMDIIDQVIEAGVNIVNPQDLVNGIDNLAREVKGRACIHLDVDRQTVMPHGSPGDVRDLVAEEVRKLGSPAGGLEMVVGIYPPTPLENVAALCDAFDAYRTYWVGR